ncbi:MAG: hypothetical protein KatS3mg002_0260 [Candidatus Woesearchaeota archaeon]|nr:MAG: hypothetical protein KatS3mg002_0260 [Candidatus Woesearchaeota archaeon]
MNYANSITEFWVKTPLTSNVEVKTAAGPLYTNDVLIKRFHDMISTSPYFKGKILDPILNMINNNIIIPVYRNKGIVDKLKHLVKNYPPNHIRGDKNVMAFYSKLDEKVFLFVESLSNFLGFSKDELMSRILVHELLHMYANQIDAYPASKKLWIKFYSHLIIELAGISDIDIKEKDIEPFVKHLYYNVERKMQFKTLGNGFWKDSAYKVLNIKNKKLEMIEYVQSEIIDKFFLKGSPLKLDHKFIQFYKAVVRAYDAVDIYVPDGVFLVQELWAPSEILAIYGESDPTDPNIIRLLEVLAKHSKKKK